MATVEMFCKNEKGAVRGETYRFTVTDKNDPALIALKLQVKEHNKQVRLNKKRLEEGYFANSYSFISDLLTRLSAQNEMYNRIMKRRCRRVRLMPRGPRREAARKDGKWASAYDCSLPHRHATHFDVYVHEVYE